MAGSLEYAFTCQVCFEEFEETGDHVPRLLPCTHTLCETCVGQMIQRDILECPECRQKYCASRGRKSFPQNKYIIVNIQMRPAPKVEQQNVRVDEESPRKSSLLPKTPPLKTIQSASQLKLDGKSNCNYYCPQTKFGARSYFHRRLSVHRGQGVSPTETSPERNPLDRDPSLYGKERAVRILLECILV